MAMALNNYKDKFEALSTREKLIILVAVLYTLYAGWEYVVLTPIQQQQKQLESQLSNVQTLLFSEQHLAKLIAERAGFDPNKANRDKLSEVKKEMTQVLQQLESGHKKLAPSNTMAKALGDILNKDNALQLIKLESLPVKPFSVSGEKVWIYRHGMALTFSGSYFDTLDYLATLEKLPWYFNWESIDYQTKQYPIAETSVKIYTLSFEENWLGV